MASLSLDVALTVLTLAAVLMSVQLIILTVEIAALRRDVHSLLRVCSAINHSVNPWADADEVTEPGFPPHLHRQRHSSWFEPAADAETPAPSRGWCGRAIVAMVRRFRG